MYTEDAEEAGAEAAEVEVVVRSAELEGRPLRPLAGVALLSSFAGCLDCGGITEGSSNWPAGVRRRPPSGLNVKRLKKFVKLSSP